MNLNLIWLVVCGGLFVSTAYYRNEVNVAEKSFAEYKQQIAENTLKAENSQRMLEQNMSVQNEKVAQNDEIRKQAFQAGIARSNDTIQQLRNELDKLSAASKNPEARPSLDGETTARELFGSCTNEYAEMAQNAERLRGQVIGLQEYLGVIHIQNQ